MRKISQTVLSLLILVSATSTYMYAEKKALQLSIFPYLTPAKIINHNKKLKDYLAKELNRPVSIITARNIKTYVKNVKKSSYDLLFTPSHVGRMGQLKAGYQPMAITKQFIQAYFIVKKDSTIKKLEETKNMTISMAPPMAIIHQIAVQDLKNVDIILGKNMKHYQTKGHTNAVISLLKGYSDLALSGVSMWRKLPPKYKNNLKILKKSTKIPGFLLMGNKNLKPELIAKIKELLLRFDKSQEGKGYLFKGYKAIDKNTMKSLDKYTKDLMK